MSEKQFVNCSKSQLMEKMIDSEWVEDGDPKDIAAIRLKWI